MPDTIPAGGAVAAKTFWNPYANAWEPAFRIVPPEQVVWDLATNAWSLKPEPPRLLRYKPSTLAHRAR